MRMRQGMGMGSEGEAEAEVGNAGYGGHGGFGRGQDAKGKGKSTTFNSLSSAHPISTPGREEQSRGLREEKGFDMYTPSTNQGAQLGNAWDGENGSNGLTLDREGRLLLCQSGNRQVVRLNAPLDSPKPVFTVLADNYQGKKFNSPNDLVADSKDNIYFTDPIYGLPKHENDPTRELKFEGVYKITPDGKLSLLIDSISRPNGIALSLDEKILYVGSSDDQHTRWDAFQLDSSGAIRSGAMLLDGAPLKAKATVKQGADGFKVDRFGDLFAAGPDGVNIISPSGKLLALIRIYNRPASNCAFNEKKDVLYITASDEVLRVRIR